MMRWILSGLVLSCLTACGGGGGGSGGTGTGTTPPAETGTGSTQPGGTGTGSNPPDVSVFPVISGAAWDATAVRQVLRVFAFGSHASDAQIHAWADMEPLGAIRQILVVTPNHDLLSPPDPLDDIANRAETLESMRAYWASDDPSNLIPPAFRDLFDDSLAPSFIAAELSWAIAVTKYGVNPVRHRIGLYETNYHMVVHQLFGNIHDRQMIGYYDAIMNAHAAGADYEDVMTTAAIAAAIATQYGHKENVYLNGQFFGNEDFGREYHQLFFGILGKYDPVAHEEVTIKNTAQALTGIRVPFTPAGFSATATFDAALHNPNDLEILGTFITGSTAREKFADLSDTAINHPESLANLPLMIISELADDSLSPSEIDQLRTGWQAMTDKNLMRFLQDYAVSPLFHSPTRVKFFATLERHFLVQNLLLLNNLESYLNIYDFFSYNTTQGVQVFKPANNVFGGERGRDAAASSEIFRNIYNTSTETWELYANASDPLGSGGTWEKDWRLALTANPVSGNYEVEYVAEWLWQRFISDGLDNFGTLERAEVYSLLSSGHNFAFLATAQADPERIYTRAEIEADPQLQTFLADLAGSLVLLASSDVGTRRLANAGIGQAINFIVATPYMMVAQGR